MHVYSSKSILRNIPVDKILEYLSLRVMASILISKHVSLLIILTYILVHMVLYIIVKGSNQLLCILVMLRMRNARAAMFMWICTQKLD